jgi:hypothetical protein
MLSYQGKLLDNNGNPVIDTAYSVQFGLYAVPSGGSAFWSENQVIRTKAGMFSILLGSVVPISALPDAGEAYLGMKVGSDPEMTPRIQIASAAYAYIARKADTANYALAGGSSGDNDWVHGGDSVLYTIRQLGVARGGSSNVLYGTGRNTHVNLGTTSTTGTSGQNYTHSTVSGGYHNVASGLYATVGGGANCQATGEGSFAAGENSIANGVNSVAFNNSACDGAIAAAFNGMYCYESMIIRCYNVHMGNGVFVMDHPVDPDGKILNQFAVGSSQMLVTYCGKAVVAANGLATVELPGYFDALCTSPTIQVSGIGTSDVFIAEEVTGNRFMVGGKPGTKFFWTVSGEREDQNAQLTRILTPVEQQKTGKMVGHSVDDDGLVGNMARLEELGLGGRFHCASPRVERLRQDSVS